MKRISVAKALEAAGYNESNPNTPGTKQALLRAIGKPTGTPNSVIDTPERFDAAETVLGFKLRPETAEPAPKPKAPARSSAKSNGSQPAPTPSAKAAGEEAPGLPVARIRRSRPKRVLRSGPVRLSAEDAATMAMLKERIDLVVPHFGTPRQRWQAPGAGNLYLEDVITGEKFVVELSEIAREFPAKYLVSPTTLNWFIDTFVGIKPLQEQFVCSLCTEEMDRKVRGYAMATILNAFEGKFDFVFNRGSGGIQLPDSHRACRMLYEVLTEADVSIDVSVQGPERSTQRAQRARALLVHDAQDGRGSKLSQIVQQASDWHRHPERPTLVKEVIHRLATIHEIVLGE